MAALIQHNYMFSQFPGAKSNSKAVELSISTDSIITGSRFVGYTSFDNHDHKKTAEFLKQPEANTPHVVREKIDGSHFSILYKNGGIMFCRRKGILQPGELFRGYDKCYTKNDQEIYDIMLNPKRSSSLRTELIEKASSLFATYGTHFILHGELFGNSWNGTNPATGFPTFQTKVEYTPSLETLWYDIYDSIANSYLSVHIANSIFKKSGFPILPIIATYPSLREALEHPFEFLDDLCSGEAGENRFTAVRSKLCDVVSKSWMSNEYVVDVLGDLDPDSPYAMFSTGEKLAAEKYIKKKIGHLIARM